MYSIFDEKHIIEITKDSAQYPSEWKRLSGAPEKLYGVGDTELLQTRKFTVVGSRRTAANTLKLTVQLARELSAEFTLVTGTADGGDGAAIEGALQGTGKIICVLAGGFSALPQAQLPLLTQVAKRGLVLSPHPYDIPVRNFSYEFRNKLLARLSVGALVVSAGETSGALITAKYARRIGIPVFALPYAPNAPTGVGCNRLIKEGACLAECAEDIFRAFGIEKREKAAAVELSADEEKLLQAVRELSEGHIAALAERSGVPPYKARAVCASLEVKGLIASIGGNRYAPV